MNLESSSLAFAISFATVWMLALLMPLVRSVPWRAILVLVPFFPLLAMRLFPLKTELKIGETLSAQSHLFFPYLHSGPAQQLLMDVVLFVATFIFLYANGRNIVDKRFSRTYFSFVGSMLGFLLFDSLILAYVFWEIMGLCSFLFIEFKDQFKNNLGRQGIFAFMTAKSTDFFLLLALIMYLKWGGNLAVSQFAESLREFEPWQQEKFLIFFAIGLLGKSAQLPFSFWLLGAMKGPTVASALIHAATMVAAGPLFFYQLGVASWASDETLWVLRLLFTATALWASLTACFAGHAKKLLGLSTIANISLMYLCLCFGFQSAALALFIGHAFMKSGLFLIVDMLAHKRNSFDLEKLAGGSFETPALFLCSLPLFLSFLCLPFMFGFDLKELVLHRVFEEGVNWFIPFVLFSIFSAIYSAKFVITLCSSASPRWRAGKKWQFEPPHVLFFLMGVTGLAPFYRSMLAPTVSFFEVIPLVSTGLILVSALMVWFFRAKGLKAPPIVFSCLSSGFGLENFFYALGPGTAGVGRAICSSGTSIFFSFGKGATGAFRFLLAFASTINTGLYLFAARLVPESLLLINSILRAIYSGGFTKSLALGIFVVFIFILAFRGLL